VWRFASSGRHRSIIEGRSERCSQRVWVIIPVAAVVVVLALLRGNGADHADG
jgi:hypothetical protein